MRAVFTRLDSGQFVGFTSVIILAEVLMLPVRLQRRYLESTYRDILMNNSSVRLIPVVAEIAEQAAHLRARYNLRTPDAIHVATALRMGCDAFLTNDRGLLRVSELSVLVLDDLEV